MTFAYVISEYSVQVSVDNEVDEQLVVNALEGPIQLRLGKLPYGEAEARADVDFGVNKTYARVQALNSNSSVTTDLAAWLTVAGAVELPSGNLFLPGDANLDGAVDGSDFSILNSHKFTSIAVW